MGKRALVWMTCLLWKETPRMPPEWKKSIKFLHFPSKPLFKAKISFWTLIPYNVFSTPYYLWFHFLYLVKIHTLGCVVSVYVSEKKKNTLKSILNQKKKKNLKIKSKKKKKKKKKKK